MVNMAHLGSDTAETVAAREAEVAYWSQFSDAEQAAWGPGEQAYHAARSPLGQRIATQADAHETGLRACDCGRKGSGIEECRSVNGSACEGPSR